MSDDNMEQEENEQETEISDEKSVNEDQEDDIDTRTPTDTLSEKTDETSTDTSRSEPDDPQTEQDDQEEAADTAATETEEKEDDPVLASDEELLLVFLDILQTNTGDLDLTGFQAKDYFEELFPDKQVDHAYSTLKQEEFLRDRRDLEPFRVTWDGQQKAEDHQEHVDEIIQQVVPLVEQKLQEDELLQRLLWLAYQDQREFQHFLPDVRPELSDEEEFLTVFFGSEQFVSHSEIERILREVRTETREHVQTKLEEFCQDPDFIKAIAVLRPDKLTQLLGVTADKSFYRGTKDVLSEWTESAAVGDTLGKLYMLGISEDQNNFNADLDAILENNEDQLREWLQFEGEKLHNRAEREWNILLDVRRAARGRPVVHTKALLEYGVLIPTSEGFLIRDEVEQIAERLAESMESDVQEKVDDIENVAAVPFFNISSARETNEDIVLSVHATDSWSIKHDYYAFVDGNENKLREPGQNILEEKIVLMASPTEFGFKEEKRYQTIGKSRVLESPTKNKEYNVLGELSGLAQAKNQFSLDWEAHDTHTAVQGAEDILKKQEIPDISFEEAIEKLGKEGPLYQEVLYLTADKCTGVTARRRGDYTTDLMWEDVWSNIRVRYPELNREGFEEIKTLLTHLVEEQADRSLLMLAANEREYIYEQVKQNLNASIIERASQLTQTEKRALLLFIEHPPKDSSRIQRGTYQKVFDNMYELQYGEQFEGRLAQLLVRVGILTKGTWVTSKGDRRGVSYKFFEGFDEVKEQLPNELSIEMEKPDIENFKENYRTSITELAGLDYLLRQEDHVTQRAELRDALLNLSSEAWMEFKAVDGIISSKDRDVITLNPSVADDLQEWLVERKRSLLDQQGQIRQLIKSADIVDLRLSFDEETGVYAGHVMTSKKEELNVLVTPWFSPEDTTFLGAENIVIITEPASEDVAETIRDREYADSLIVRLQEAGLSVYSDLSYQRFVDNFVEALSEEYELIHRDIDVPEEAEIEKTESSNTTAAAAGEMDPDSSTGSGNLFDELFTVHGGRFPRDIPPDEPIILLLHSPSADDYGMTLQFISRELYHYLSGGLPTPRIRGNRGSIEETLTAEGRVEYINEEDDEFFEGELTGKNIGSGGVRWDRIRRRLDELYSQGLGFVIFELPPDLVSDFKHQLDRELDSQPKVYELEPRLSDPFIDARSEVPQDMGAEIKRRVANGLWSFALEENYSTSTLFDELFTTCNRAFSDTLLDFQSEPIRGRHSERTVEFLVNRSPEQEDDPNRNESDLHYLLKAFVVRYLAETEKYDIGSVATEDETTLANSKGQDVIPDVQTGKKVFEVETLYGSGRPLSKIKETVEDYKDGTHEVNIVLTALSGFLYYKELLRLRQDIIDEWGVVMNLKIPMLREKQLVDLEVLSQVVPDDID